MNQKIICALLLVFAISCSSEKEKKEESKSEESTEKNVAPEEESPEMDTPAEEEISTEKELPTPTPISEAELEQDKIQEEKMSGNDVKSEGSGVKAKVVPKNEITVGEEGVR